MRADRQFHGYGVLVLVVPFLVYLVGMTVSGWFDGVPYPVRYSLVVGATLGLALALSRGYACVPFSAHWLSVATGVLGVFVWIGLWRVDQAFLGLGSLLGPAREGFNPFEQLQDSAIWMWAFLAIRFTGLVLVVPLTEELFVRGFLMRYLESGDWDRVPLARVTRLSAGGVAVYALLSHPAEPLSAVVWFSMVTWMYRRTGSIWDCVLAHAITNLLLGLYVVATGTWALW